MDAKTPPLPAGLQWQIIPPPKGMDIKLVLDGHEISLASRGYPTLMGQFGEYEVFISFWRKAEPKIDGQAA